MGAEIKKLDLENLPIASTQLDLLAELGQQFAQSIDIQTTLRSVVDRVVLHMNAEAASIFLVDDEGLQLECKACCGPVNILGLTLSMGQGIVGRTATEECCQLVIDVASDPDFVNVVDQDTGFRTNSTICTPLKTANGVIGVLQVLNKKNGGRFSETDSEFLRLLASPTAMAINNARMASDLLEQKQLQQELFLARRLQRSLLPRKAQHDSALHGITLPARQVSGDFYDYFELPDGRIGFTIGDVSGKGMNAALLMVRATSLLRWVGKSGVNPGLWLSKVNNELLEAVADGMFVCAIAGYYDPSSGDVVWANAGFPAALHRTQTGVYQTIPARSPPLAIIEQGELEQEHCQLKSDTIYFYSDGVSEARSANGEMLEDAGFREIIEAYSGYAAKPRLGKLVGYLRKMDLRDDTTILVLEGQCE